MESIDYLVCGAGIAGASLGAELAAHGRVAIVEPEDVAGYHTTGRSAALYIASYGNAAIRALTAASRAFFDAPPEGFVDHPLLTARGCLHIASAAQRAALDERAGDLGAADVGARRLDAAAVMALNPSLRRDVVIGGVFEPGAADIDVAALHAGYLRLARARGARLVTGAGLAHAERRGARWGVVLTDGRALDAGILVNAAGAWGDRVAARADVAPIGLTPCVRTALIIDPPAGMDPARWPAVIDVADQFYFKPEAGKLLASPADETPSEPLDAAPAEIDIATCIERIQAVADIPVRRVLRAWAGLRTFAPDRSPVIGFDDAAPGFFWFVGQGGYGMQIAPAAARLGAALAAGDAAPDDLVRAGAPAALFAPARFARHGGGKPG